VEPGKTLATGGQRGCSSNSIGNADELNLCVVVSEGVMVRCWEMKEKKRNVISRTHRITTCSFLSHGEDPRATKPLYEQLQHACALTMFPIIVCSERAFIIRLINLNKAMTMIDFESSLPPIMHCGVPKIAALEVIVDINSETIVPGKDG
jgi:hypothetical protein